MKGKKFNMAEAGYCDADVYDCQVKAHESFLEDKVLPSDFKELQNEDRPSSMSEDWKGKVYDITGFDGQQVVAVLSLIVNNRTEFKESGKTFYLLIRNSSEDHQEAEYQPLYRLTAAPTTDQPGNGIVVLRPKGSVEFPEHGKRYSMLNAALKIYYKTNTTSFAKDIRKLLKRNTQNKGIPEATIEVYMILLFEIARRLVKTENPSPRNKALDSLPMGSAIARLINLLELRKSTFDDVFLSSKRRFHCFKGEWDVRRKAIETINEATAKKGTDEQLLKELQELFCSDQRLEEISSEKLAKTLKDMSLNERP